MHKAVSLFTITAAIIVAAWWWLGKAVEMPPSPLEPGAKLYCVSYAPFRGSQSPLDLSTRIDPSQIEQDLAQLARITNCIRIYSADFGLAAVPEIARRHGLKVLLGIWVSSHADRTKWQIDTGVALARQYPDVVQAVIVGNEALLRGEIAPAALADLIRNVKSQVPMPVTYADVWEFWLKNSALAQTADFVTIHILPYWEDDPIPARDAADHIDSIRRRVAAAFPAKEIVIGEVGWPSAGRMREAALPSPVNQALVIQDILARGKRENFRVNVIEAYDQPWKRYLEGTVGGYWGLYDDARRAQKFAWGAPVSNHPNWRWQAAGGIVLAGAMFAVAWIARRRRPADDANDWPIWIGVALNACAAGVLAGWMIDSAMIESLGTGGWLRSIALVVVGLAAPVAASAALARGTPTPAFARVIGARTDRVPDRLAQLLGLLLVALTIVAIEAALGLAFNPRYRDFPFTAITAAAVPYAVLSFATLRRGQVPYAEAVAATVLLLCAIVIIWRETFSNWQALWLSGALVLLALTLFRARDGRG